MDIISGTIVSQCGYNGGWHAYGDVSQFAGRKNSGDCYPYILKLTTHSFSGISKSLNIMLGAYEPYSYGSVTLRYALCSSDENRSKYQGTYSEVSDQYQITTGTTTFSNLTASVKTYEIKIGTIELLPNTTYYLYLWGSNTAGYIEVANTEHHSVSLEYYSGIVYIDNGSSFDAYEVYVDNGTSWDKCIPYIDNGSSWDICS